jgi:hypothetical protein
MLSSIFDDEFFKKLRLLKLMAQRLIGAGSEGERIGRRRGGNIEFKDYRKYSGGDEPRYIDWNLYGRTERLYVKEFAKEDSFPIYLLLDQSASMQPNENTPHRLRLLVSAKSKTAIQKTNAKFTKAKQLTAALGYIGLLAGSPTRLIGFNSSTQDETIQPEFTLSPILHRDREIKSLLTLLEGLPAQGETHLAAILKQAHEVIRSRGLLILVSDLFEQNHAKEHTNTRRALLKFRARGFEVCIIHILSRSEETPQLAGWMNLQDSETKEPQRAFVSDSTLKTYHDLLTNFTEDWRKFCLGHDIKYFYVNEAMPLEKVVFDFLRRGGLLK